VVRRGASGALEGGGDRVRRVGAAAQGLVHPVRPAVVGVAVAQQVDSAFADQRAAAFETALRDRQAVQLGRVEV